MMAAISDFKRLGSSHVDSKNVIHSFWLNLMMSAILKSTMLNLAILLSDILVYLLNSLTLAKIGSHHLHKKNFTHSFWLNLMMDAICEFCLSWIQPFWKKKTSVIHSDSTWWWQPSWNLPSWIQTLQSWMQLLVIFTQIHSKTLWLHSDSDSG